MIPSAFLPTLFNIHWLHIHNQDLFKTSYFLIIKSLCLNLSIHLSTSSLALRHRLQSCENLVLGSLKCFFQVDQQVNISLYSTDDSALHHFRKLTGLKPSWCAFSPISPFGFLDFKINFISFIGDKQQENEPWGMMSLCDMLYISCWWDKNNHFILTGAQEDKKCERCCKLSCEQCLKQNGYGINRGRFGGLVDGVGFKHIKDKQQSPPISRDMVYIVVAWNLLYSSWGWTFHWIPKWCALVTMKLNPLIHGNFMEKNKCIRIDGKPENGFR